MPLRLLLLAAIAFGVLGLVPLWLALIAIGGSTTVMVLDMVLTIQDSRQSQRPSGGAAMVGETAVARTPLSPDGIVFIRGERWNARLEDGGATSGQPVEIVGAEGLKLRVRRAAGESD